ncbi:MAG: hypothetical protein LBD79_10110 [Treponema sp.]|jgi:hypothetical protein|nr:hypothetical protein [Treponema sp.]
MDINFHYFTVKTLARKAGFTEEKAQRIAEYSEFIDDFNWIKSVTATNIPDNIVTSTRYDMYDGVNTFRPVTTGFTSIIDYAILLTKNAQRFYISPFHFIPKSLGDLGNKEIRTSQARIGDNSLISNALVEARDIFIKQTDSAQCSTNLMRIGMLLHPFADTCAHQMFSGYNSWVNDVKKRQVVDNITGDDITEQMGVGNTDTPSFYDDAKPSGSADGGDVDTPPHLEQGIPFFSIGHMDMGHVPDLTNITFAMGCHRNKGDKYEGAYSRSNTYEFLTFSRDILDYLRSCLGKLPLPDNEWSAFSAKVRLGFLIKMPSSDVNTKLATHWAKVFSSAPEDPDMLDIQYHFDSKEIEQRFKGTAKNEYTDEFYTYNLLADEWLATLYGDKPRQTTAND